MSGFPTERDHDMRAHSIQQLLDGVDSPTPLPLQSNDRRKPSQEISVARQVLSVSDYVQISQCMLDEELSVDTLVQLAWGMLLGRYGAGTDVLFSENWSASDADVAGLSNVVTPCDVRLPVRVKTDPSQTTRDALKALHGWQQLSLIHI